MSINDDKRELLKLKQGLIEESEIIKEEKPQKIELHGRKKIENFFYHNKIAIILTVFFATLGIFFIYEIATQKRPDIRAMLISSTEESYLAFYEKSDDISAGLEKFSLDYDNNGYIYAETYYIDIFSEYDANMLVANQTKLFAEIQTGQMRIFIGNREAYDRILGEDYSLTEVFINLKELYPDNENIYEDVFYKAKGSELAKASEWDDFCPEDMYIALLAINTKDKKAAQFNERSLEVFDNIVNGRYAENE